MLKILLSFSLLLLISFHNLSFQNVDGNTINMSSFQGKKVLIANIATNSDKVNQLAGLQQLQQQYGDSLVVIVFPSNSFGHESRSNTEIKQYCQSNYNSTFIIAAKSSVTGTDINTVFDWLANKTLNGEMDAVTGGDFQKFLVDKDGMLIGVFSPKVSPTDSEIIEAITKSF
jgi:glutathione peroxidase